MCRISKTKSKNTKRTFRTWRVLSFLAAILPMNPRMLISLTLTASHDVSVVTWHNMVTCSPVIHCEKGKNISWMATARKPIFRPRAVDFLSGSKFVRTSACRTLTDFSSADKNLHLFASGRWIQTSLRQDWPRRAISGRSRFSMSCQALSASVRWIKTICRTLADKWRFLCRPTKNRLMCGGL